jgi:gliding motility-associated-like protein
MSSFITSHFKKAFTMLLISYCCLGLHAQVKLNEVMVRPGGNQGLIIFNSNSGNEYIELYNPSCSPVDVSGFFIACRQDFAGTVSGGAFRIPNVAAATIPPAGHLVLGTSTGSADPNSIDIKLPSFTSNYCLNNSGYNFILANADGWVALYDATGLPIDALYWTSAAGNIATQPSDFGGVPCVPTGSPVGTVLESAQQINTGFPGVLSYGGVNPSAGLTFSRVPDGAAWQTGVSPSVNDLTVGNCNGGTCATVSSVAFTASKTNPTCGNNNGNIALTVTSIGTATYTWSANAATGNLSTASNLGAGTYSVTVAQNGCTKDTIITLTASGAPTFTSSVTNATCGLANGSISISVTSAGAASYSWSANAATGNSATASNLGAGTYNVTVSQNGCTKDTSLTITTSTKPVFTANLTNATCGLSNGSIVVNTTTPGTATYTWSANAATGNSATASNLGAGTYNVTVVQNGCTKDTSLTITTTTKPVFTANLTNATCDLINGSISVSVSTPGTATYTWSANAATGNSATASNLGAGSYNVTVAQNGCTKDSVFTLTSTSKPIFTYSTTNPTCGQNNGSITINVTSTGAATYTWSANAATGNSATASTLIAGTYTVTVLQNGCTKDTSILLNSSSTINLSITNPINPTCAGHDGSITVALSGGTAPYTVTIDTGGTPFTINVPIAISQTINNLPAGTVSVSVTDLATCQNSTSATLTAPTNCCTFSLAAMLTQPACNSTNGQIAVTVSNGSGNYSYGWSANASTGNNATASNLGAASYTVTITDNAYSNCSKDSTFTLSNPNAPNIANVAIGNETCAGTNDGSITVSASGGTGLLTYIWSANANTGNTPAAINLTAGTYAFTVADANNCQSTGNGTVIANICCNLQTSVTENTTTCGLNNGSAQITVLSGGQLPYNYSINGGIAQPNNLFSNLAAGTYEIISIDGNGCRDTLMANIPASVNSLSVSVSAIDVTCNGFADGTATANPVGGNGIIAYNWNTGLTSPSIVSLLAGTYTVSATDGDGCTASGSGVINEPSPVICNLGNDTSLCNGTQFLISAPTGFSTYSWNTGETSNTVLTAISGTYDLTVTDANGCTATDSIHVSFNNAATIDLGNDLSIYEGGKVGIFPTISGNNKGTFLWQPATGLSCTNCLNTVASPNENTTYTLAYLDENGCIVNDTINVSVLPIGNIYFPNAFSPNGDGANDYYQAFGTSPKFFRLKIFNRWGELVYDTDNFNEGWDGKFKGELQPNGIYTYMAKFVLLNDKTFDIKGSITLLK